MIASPLPRISLCRATVKLLFLPLHPLGEQTVLGDPDVDRSSVLACVVFGPFGAFLFALTSSGVSLGCFIFVHDTCNELFTTLLVYPYLHTDYPCPFVTCTN